MHPQLEHYLEAPILTSGTKYLQSISAANSKPQWKVRGRDGDGVLFYVKFVHHKRVEDPSF